MKNGIIDRTGEEAEEVLAGADAVLVGIFSPGREEVLEALGPEDGVGPHETALHFAEAPGHFGGSSVDLAGVEIAGREVQTIAGTLEIKKENLQFLK